ncbi:hypothetical protein [Avibacterium sp. 21-599]|uniref:hypothetical protein n=1 Tax=Avibacterium sp. 21-599 TaxID=2911528 RepID=UPI0022486A45|nr:hypothetical protein [Avibacterium sp. 21-599]MCW9717189.1 hypothetical protein [Avibacterium sp. 21-599]
MMTSISLKKLLFFWTAVVLFNTAVCFFFGLLISSHPMSILGMCIGVLCFIAFYTFVDYHLLIKQKLRWHKALRRSALIRGGLQIAVLLHVSIEFWCGFLALALLEVLFGSSLPLFLHSFLATLLTGLFLSVILAILCVICFFLAKPKKQLNQ